MAHIEYSPTAEALAFSQTMGETLQAISHSKQDHMMTTKTVSKTKWSKAAADTYHERATNPKAAKHDKPFLSAVTSNGMFGKVKPNEGEYMAGWRQQALTVPDRSIAALKHPKWLSGRAVCEMFPTPSLEMMGPNHPVKEHIRNQVDHMRKEVLEKGPIVGPKNAKERLKLKEEDEELNGKGLPRWKPCFRYNKPFNPLVLQRSNFLPDKLQAKGMTAHCGCDRPDRCNPHLPQMYTRGVGGLFNPIKH